MDSMSALSTPNLVRYIARDALQKLVHYLGLSILFLLSLQRNSVHCFLSKSIILIQFDFKNVCVPVHIGCVCACDQK